MSDQLVEDCRKALMLSKKAQNYLADVRIGFDAVRQFELGYYNHTQTSMYYDRLMFPIRDVYGNFLTFQGRALFDWKEAKKPKYWHGPYEKSEVLYGLNVNAKAIRQKNVVVLLEGPLDVIALWQSRIPAVACLGTALTEYHAFLLRSFTDTVIMWFDNDKAGLNATNNACKILEEYAFKEIKIVTSEYKDPSEVYIEHGPVGVRQEVLNVHRTI